MTNSKFITTLILPNGIRQCNAIGVEELTKEGAIDIDPFFIKNYKLTGNITFIGEDFKALHNWERSDKRCDKGTLVIHEVKPAGKQEVLRVVIGPDDVKWDPEKCKCTLYVEKTDERYYKFNEIKEVKYNLYDVASSVILWWDSNPSGGGPFHRQIPNGILVLDALQGMLRKGYPNMTVKSKMLGWNDTVTYTIGHSNMLQKLILSHNSDIYDAYLTKSPAPATPATILETSLVEFLDTFCYLLNLRCDIEGASVFRIEHASYWENPLPTTTDVRTGENYDFNKGVLSKYEHDNSDRYSREDFKPFINADGGDASFKGSPIIYNTCNNINTKKLDKSANFTTQIKYGADFAPDIDIRKGMFLGALNPANDQLQLASIVIPVPGAPYSPATLEVGGTTWSDYNKILSWMACIYDYHRHWKSYKTFYIEDPQLPPPGSGSYNGLIELSATTTKRYVVQKGIKVKDCYNNLELLNTQIVTNLGTGRVMKTTKKIGTPYAECDVYFYDNAINTIASPTAKPDKYNATKNVVLNTFSSSLSPVNSNDVPVNCPCYVEDKPTRFGGNVKISANGHFIYTPPADYSGTDEFDYSIINNGLVSTSTVTITIT